MLLSNLLSLNGELDVEILQEAYYDIIKKIRLYPALFPVQLSGIMGIDDFNIKANLPNDSEVAIKQIISLHGCTYSDDLPVTGSYSALEIGNPKASNYSLSNYSSVNDTHKVEPHIIKYGDTFYCEDTDPAMFFILCYPYPYAVTVDGSDPFTDKHLYDIQDMKDNEGYANSELDICDALIYPLTTKAMSIIYQRDDDLAYSSRYEQLTLRLLNLFNRNPAFMKLQKISTIGKIVGGDI